MKVVVAEKPSVARELARVLGAKVRREGYLEGNGYQVTWAIGHLVGLADTKDYGYPFWALSNLPIIPQEFETKITSDQGRARQFRVIEHLLRDAEEVICATDAGREGELIFRYIYLQAKCDKPFSRLWISSQTDKALKEGLANLKPGNNYDNLYAAARCRSEADWLVGINATQAFTLKYGQQAPFTTPGKKRMQPISLGRVQTPVLKLLVDRYLEVKAFKPETYWELMLTLEKDGTAFQAKWFHNDTDRFSEEEKGKEVLEKLTGQATVMAANKKPKREFPPLLYDLTELQKDANKRYNFSAQKTLDLAQELYEKFKVITYPRTDSRYLSDDIFPTIPGLLDNLAGVSAYAPFVAKAKALGLEKDSRVFNDSKVSDHHAITPTETDPRSVTLPKEHYMIYDLVVRRLLGAFLGNCQKEVSEIILVDAEEQFQAKGTMVKELGWREVYVALEKALEKRKEKEGKKKKSKKGDDVELPYVEVGEVLEEKAKDLLKKKTKAPAMHTESSILALMETCGKEMEDEELREAMKDRGLGTPATRASMIERLLQRNYIKRDKKKLVPTERGLALIDLVRDRPIASPELTGEWESRLFRMSKGDYDDEQFMTEVKQYTRGIIEAVTHGGRNRTAAPQIRPMPDYNMEGVPCPRCHEGTLLKGRRAFGCSRYKEGCAFTIKPLIAGNMVPKEHLEELVREGATSKFVKGFTSRAGKQFDARLRLTESGKVEFFFDRVSAPPAEHSSPNSPPSSN